MILLLPFAALIAGSAGEIARLVFGPAFMSAGPLMALLVFAPRLGPIGAAAVTTTVAGLAALAALVVVDRTFRIRPPAATFWRSLIVAGPAYVVAAAWSTAGLALFVKLMVIGALTGVALAFLGELGAPELGLARSLLGRAADDGGTPASPRRIR